MTPAAIESHYRATGAAVKFNSRLNRAPVLMKYRNDRIEKLCTMFAA